MLCSTDGTNLSFFLLLDFSMYTIVNGPLLLEALACSFVYEFISFSPIMNCSSFCMKEVFKREREKKTKGLTFVWELFQSCLYLFLLAGFIWSHLGFFNTFVTFALGKS